MDWDDLRFLVVAHRHPTVTAAAKSLGVEQTTVTRRLRALESKMGVPLYERLRGGVVLTPAGASCLEAGIEMEERVHALDRSLLGQRAELTGELRITLPSILAAAWVEVFLEFTDAHPKVDLIIASDDQVRNLTRREADIALRWTNRPPEHLVGRKLVELAVTPHGRTADPELPWVGWESGIAKGLLDAWLLEHCSDATPLLRVTEFHVLVELLRSGRVQGLLPVGVGRRLGLVQIGPVDPAFRTWIWMLTHADLRRVPRVRAFFDHLAGWADRLGR